MAEWLIEQGIGEHRALRVDRDQVVAAKLHWPGELYAGQVVRGRLEAKPAGARRGTVKLASGDEVLVDHLPAGLTEGAELGVCIVRAPIAERGRYKRAQGRFVPDGLSMGEPPHPLPAGRIVRRFPAGTWEEVWSAAASGTVEFPSGRIVCAVTPAMTLLDVDGPDDPARTASASVGAIVRALSWFDLGGSIGIDFPTVRTKVERKNIDALLDAALRDWPHERTAMNGFGFVQLVASLQGPSLLHRMATSRVAAAARMALRRGEMVEGPGTTLLTVHPALRAKLKPEWIAELERRTGRPARLATDPGLALEAAQAQIASHEQVSSPLPDLPQATQ